MSEQVLSGNEDIRAFIDKLTSSTKVSEYVELPMIAVMGDTSSGKSSLLSSISGVELPSSSQLTTRCPVMLQMKRADQKEAKVNVQWKDIPEGKTKMDVSFTEKIITEENWQSLSDTIATAQEHIIRQSGKEVARDIVQVQVQGPTCENLTLVDLPGIVRARGLNEGEAMAEDIQTLINEYLGNTRCVILGVVPANVDFHNSQILADALKVDPFTKRTIPVITKPDLIDSGAEKDVLDLLMGLKTQRYQMGFHMVKGRGQNDLDNNISIEKGIQNEASFFLKAQPWRDVTTRDLFGTQTLRKKLGELQMDLIQKTLPAITEEIQNKYEIANDELKSMGDIPNSKAEKRVFFHKFSEAFYSSISAMLGGVATQRESKRRRLDEDTFASKLHALCDSFKAKIQSASFVGMKNITSGKDVIVTQSDGSEIGGKVICMDDSGNCFVDYNGRETAHNEDLLLQYHKWTEGDDQKKPGTQWKSERGNICIANGNGYDELKAVSANRIRRDPSWLMSRIQRNRTDDLPVFVNKEVFEAIFADFIDNEWSGPCQNLVTEAQKLLSEATGESLKPSSQYPRLREFVRRKLEDKILQLANKAKEQVEYFIEKERKPYTQNDYLHENLAKVRFDPVFRALEVALGFQDKNETKNSEPMNSSSVHAILQAVREQNQRKSVEEHMAEEMQNALDAYSKVALKRFIDGIPMECWNMFRSYRNDVRDILANVSDDDVDKFLVVSKSAQRRHEELLFQSQELKAAIDVLEQLYY